MTIIHLMIATIVANSLSVFCFWLYIFHHERTHKDLESKIIQPLMDEILKLQSEKFDRK